ncbi:MAG: hypothetical protein AAGC77_04870 [Pseudomonadota bacterium]
MGISVLLHASAAAETPRVSLSTGFDYSTGDYGLDADTELVFVPISGRLSIGDFSIRATSAYVSLSGPGSIVSLEDGPDVVEGGAGDTDTISGMSDLSLSAGYRYRPENPDAMSLSFSAGVKVPTADTTSGLGTGSTDFRLRAEATQPIGDAAVFGSLGYRIAGSSDTVALKNTVAIGGGVQFPLLDNFDAIAGLDYRQASSNGAEDSVEASVFFSSRLAPSVYVLPYVYTGFTESSPDIGVGMFLTVRFD